MGTGKMLVTNFASSTSEEELRELFSLHGRVKQVEIIYSKGLGFVEMFKKSEARNAVLALNGTEFKNSTLKVQEARPFNDKGHKRSWKR